MYHEERRSVRKRFAILFATALASISGATACAEGAKEEMSNQEQEVQEVQQQVEEQAREAKQQIEGEPQEAKQQIDQAKQEVEKQ
jgi:cysteine sulfinate desulfinase/cysteine desulfurase-like protein